MKCECCGRDKREGLEVCSSYFRSTEPPERQDFRIFVCSACVEHMRLREWVDSTMQCMRSLVADYSQRIKNI